MQGAGGKPDLHSYIVRKFARSALMKLKKYFRRRSVEGLLTETRKEHELERTLGWFQLLLLGIGAIIGAGIFVLAGSAAQVAGPSIILSFILAGLACMCVAFCYAEMASTIPISGSAYAYIYASIGELPAWLTGGMMSLTYLFGAAMVASGWSGYFVSFLNDHGIYFPAILAGASGELIPTAGGEHVRAMMNLPAILIVLFVTTILYIGTQTSSTVNAVIVVVKMVVLTLFVILGATVINPDNWVPFIPENVGEFGQFGLSGIVSGAALILMAYCGFDAVATAAQETKKPKRDLPIAIIGSLAIAITVYILVCLTLTGVVHFTELNVPDPMGVAANVMGYPWFSVVVKAGAIISLTSVVLVLMFAAIRVYYNITHDGLLPKRLAAVNKKHHTPHILTWGIGLIICLLSTLLPLPILQAVSSFGTMMTFVMVCVATLYLRYQRPDLKREFRCPWVPFTPLVGILLFGSMIYSLPVESFKYIVGWFVLLLVIYFGYSVRHSELGLKHPHHHHPAPSPQSQ